MPSSAEAAGGSGGSDSATPQKPNGDLKVLLVDDSHSYRRELRGLLELEQFQVVGEAENGLDAIELAERLKPDIVLMDQNMPVLSGIEATRRIKQRQPEIRVLFVAAEGAWREKALMAGAEAYFIKEGEMRFLLRAMQDRSHSRGAQAVKTEGARRRLAARLALILLSVLAGAALLSWALTNPSSILPAAALISGLTFFLYGLKYYASIAIVLFSTNGTRNGNGYHNGNGNGGVNGKQNGRGLNKPGSTLGGNGRLAHHPFVSVHLPLYNEKVVVDRLLTACTSFEYDNYEVIVADDSTDQTTEILEQRWSSHPRVKLSRRSDRTGFKGGALKVALQRTDKRAEFIVVLDADFIPPPDLLQQFLVYFYGENGINGNGAAHAGQQDHQPQLLDDRVAVVQGYQWHILNASENWITKGIRSEFSGSYVVERSSQEVIGGMKMISGSVFMIRANVLREHGWGTSITEDWELTLRLYRSGYKVLYSPFVQAPAECVSDFKQLSRQRMRWAEGHTYNVKRFFSSILRSPNLDWREKFEFLYYAPYYLQSVLFVIGTLSWLVSELILKSELPFWTEALGWSLVFVNGFSLIMMNLAGLFLERGVRSNWTGLLSFVLLTILLVPYQAYAALKGLIEPHEGGWHRTQKSGVITEYVNRLSLGRRLKRLRPKKKKRPSIDLEKRLGTPAARFSWLLPRSLRRVPNPTLLAIGLTAAMAMVLLIVAILSSSVIAVSAAPDVFYLHVTDTVGITPAGKIMNNTSP